MLSFLVLAISCAQLMVKDASKSFRRSITHEKEIYAFLMIHYLDACVINEFRDLFSTFEKKIDFIVYEFQENYKIGDEAKSKILFQDLSKRIEVVKTAFFAEFNKFYFDNAVYQFVTYNFVFHLNGFFKDFEFAIKNI